MPPPPFNIAVPMNNGNCVERGRLYFATIPPLFHLFRAQVGQVANRWRKKRVRLGDICFVR